MNWTELLNWVLESVIYSVLWVIIMLWCFGAVCKVTDFSMKKELIEDENMALWIMFAGFFVAVAIIIAAATAG